MFCLKLINRINIFLIEQIKDRFQVAMNIMIFQFHRTLMHSKVNGKLQKNTLVKKKRIAVVRIEPPTLRVRDQHHTIML